MNTIWVTSKTGFSLMSRMVWNLANFIFVKDGDKWTVLKNRIGEHGHKLTYIEAKKLSGSF